jgi:hypothetical protein
VSRFAGMVEPTELPSGANLSCHSIIVTDSVQRFQY